MFTRRRTILQGKSKGQENVWQRRPLTELWVASISLFGYYRSSPEIPIALLHIKAPHQSSIHRNSLLSRNRYLSWKFKIEGVFPEIPVLSESLYSSTIRMNEYSSSSISYRLRRWGEGRSESSPQLNSNQSICCLGISCHVQQMSTPGSPEIWLNWHPASYC